MTVKTISPLSFDPEVQAPVCAALDAVKQCGMEIVLRRTGHISGRQVQSLEVWVAQSSIDGIKAWHTCILGLSEEQGDPDERGRLVSLLGRFTAEYTQ